MDKFKQSAITFLLYWLTRLLGKSYRYEYINWDYHKKIKRKFWQEKGCSENYIYCLWHQNLMGSLLSQANIPHCVLVSPSKDGEILAQVCQRMQYKVARGSSSREGLRGIAEQLKYLRIGFPGAVTVDGPKGPAHEVKKGVLEIARKAQIPIFAFSAYPQKYWSFKKSWDQFRVPKPFTRIAIHISLPIFVESSATSEDTDRLAEKIKHFLLEGEEMGRNYFRDVNNLRAQHLS